MPKAVHLVLIVSLTLLCAAAFAEAGAPAPEVTCSACHVVAEPTADNFALKMSCTRPGVGGSVGLVPVSVVIDQMADVADIYVPVVFSHGAHAKMSEMGDGCTGCHHHGTKPRIQACKECHDKGSDAADLKQPGLKGAYHRQCLGCHREWTHDTECAACHAKHAAAGDHGEAATSTSVLGMAHPKIKAPVTEVYRTPKQKTKGEEKPTLVTFQHGDHSERFGFSCADCHKQEGCGRCHDLGEKPERPKKKKHANCKSCHEIRDKCMDCHTTAKTLPFNHETRTGFAIKAFHEPLTCAQCHDEAPKNFEGLEAACACCHEKDWMPEGFDHALAGIALDEEHAEVECASCHGAGLGQTVSCEECHEEDISYPENSPGEVVAQSR